VKALAPLSLALCLLLALSQSALAQDRLIMHDGSTFEVNIVEENDVVVRFYLLEDDAKTVTSTEKKYIDRIERAISKRAISKRYATWISIYNRPSELFGVLYEVKDSSIVVSSKEVFSNNIKTIKIRREKNKGRGTLIGAATGFVVGVVIGLALGDDPPCPPPFIFDAVSL